jgi:hypothetical protein
MRHKLIFVNCVICRQSFVVVLLVVRSVPAWELVAEESGTLETACGSWLGDHHAVSVFDAQSRTFTGYDGDG